MIELLISLFSTAGSAGFGSLLKQVGNFFQGRHDAKMADIAARAQNAAVFQKFLSEGPQAKSSAFTRRLLGAMLVGLICFIGVWGITHPQDQFTTFIIPEAKQGWKFLWGLFTFPTTKDVTVVLTSGHLALMSLNIAAISVGFYFTPSGRR